MKHEARNTLIFLASCFLLLASFLSLGISVNKNALESLQEDETQSTAKNEENIQETHCIGQIIKIISDDQEELPSGNKQRSQQLLIKILTGPDKNKERPALNTIPDNPAFAIIGELERKYLVTKVENLDTGNEDYFLIDYYREPFIWFLCGLFLTMLVIVGGKKGIRTIISLLGTIGFIAFLLIPGVVKGFNPLLVAVLVSFLATGLTMILVAGLNAKSLASTLGTVIGVSLSGVIASVVIKTAPLSGLASSEAMILWGNQFYEINFKGLLAAGMIVSCLGAIMDVAISISSAIYEIKIANQNYLIQDLFKSGMNVGKDIMGTMTSTLVLAYTGMALPLLLLISHEKNPAKFLNLELVVSELTAAISGSIGLIIAVPATALIMAWLVSRKRNGEPVMGQRGE